ncbi:MAG: hypothetical protein J6P05_00080 [Lachnospiraceae bacterium]|nr:hypothetical protein [Lachnospiraceae bacterium]
MDTRERLNMDGYQPIKRDLRKTEVLRHESRMNEEGEDKSHKKRKKRKAADTQASVFGVSMEAICLVALLLIIIVLFGAAIGRVELTELSVPVMAITTIIVIIMGFIMGGAPSFVSLIIVALILLAGALTGMLSEVLVGVIVFMGTVIVIKEKNYWYS